MTDSEREELAKITANLEQELLKNWRERERKRLGLIAPRSGK